MLILAHAVAKALFTSIIVIATTNSQDLQEMGGLGRTMPITASGLSWVRWASWIAAIGWFFGRCSEGWIASG